MKQKLFSVTNPRMKDVHKATDSSHVWVWLSVRFRQYYENNDAIYQRIDSWCCPECGVYKDTERKEESEIVPHWFK